MRWPQTEKVKVITSRRQSDACLPITRQRKVAQAPKFAGRLIAPRATLHKSSKAKGSKVKVTGWINAMTEAISSDNEGLRVQTWNTDAARKPALAARWPSTWKLRVGWLFKSPLAGGGDILCRPHYRPYSWF